MKIENIDAISYKKGIMEEVVEKVVKDETIHLTINNQHERNLSGIEDSLKEFAVGYLFNEKMVTSMDDILDIKIKENYIDVQINDRMLRNNETVLCSDSSGGWRCKIKEVNKVESDLQVTAGELISRIEELKDSAEIWQATGGTHVAGLVCEDRFLVKEDVSRHVAVDKAIGSAILEGLDLSKSYVIYSGRMPADMVIKLTRVGIPLLVSNAAPSLSGYEIAKKGDVTLVGFLRGQRFNVYNNKNRIIFE